ncbi:hypothetical protein PVK06_002324 [Gossypium arboreum]|uniref:Zinc finger BED domain-containing protein RICESLEEPER 2-like n=1 Tax=Gossypium arboreum TaxID=29729 RepID=A0ABR0R3A4_GOSAR|nr:hypothetical protein PVK06_002324 [Gossypium arboreum]
MSYNLEQGHYSYLCTGSSSLVVVIEGNGIFNAQDTTHKRPTSDGAGCLDDIEVATYTMRNRKKTSIVWKELAIVKLADRIEKVQSHFVDSDWNLQKKVLNFVDVPPLHSGVLVYGALYKCLQDKGVEGKVCSIFMDNASYNNAAVRMLKDSLSFHKRLLLNKKLFHIRCYAHILNLLVHDGLFKIEDVIDNVKESVKHIIASTVRLTMFSDIVK